MNGSSYARALNTCLFSKPSRMLTYGTSVRTKALKIVVANISRNLKEKIPLKTVDYRIFIQLKEGS